MMNYEMMIGWPGQAQGLGMRRNGGRPNMRLLATSGRLTLAWYGSAVHDGLALPAHLIKGIDAGP